MSAEPLVASEAECQATIIAAANTLGYLAHHTRPAHTAKGWRTPIAGNPGFPDLVIAGHGMVFVVELKRRGNRPTDAQKQWLHELDRARAGGGVRVGTLIVPDEQQAFIDTLARHARKGRHA